MVRNFYYGNTFSTMVCNLGEETNAILLICAEDKVKRTLSGNLINSMF